MLEDGNLDAFNYEINAMQADFCAAIGDVNRVRIVYALTHAPHNVKTLANILNLSPSATSRHLRILREKGLVEANRSGHSVEYSLAAPELLDAFDILLNILNTQLTHRASLIELERYDEEQ